MKITEVNKTKVWVAGSRTITDYNYVGIILKATIKKNDIIRTGGAMGVDRLTEQWCKDNNIQLAPSLCPDWKKHGKGAGFIRNREGVTWATICVVIWDGVSKGSEHVIREARKQMKRVLVFD